MALTVSYFAFTALYVVCFALALTVCGIYGSDLQSSHKVDLYDGSKWAYAVVVGAFSAVTCIVYFVPLVLEVASFIVVVWNAILFIFWIALFGIFAKLYIDEDAHGDGSVLRMKHTVWVNLTSALLWLFATIGVFVYWLKHRNNRSLFTGRARV